MSKAFSHHIGENGETQYSAQELRYGSMLGGTERKRFKAPDKRQSLPV